MAVCQDGQATSACVGCVADVGSPPVTWRTRYDVASVTKPLLARLALLEAAAGRLQLSAKVADYLESFSSSQRRSCTVADLMRHTAALPSVPDLCMKMPSAQALRDAFDALPLEGRPGSKVGYTSLGYQYLGQILTKQTGSTLDVLTEERLFRPLGLEDIGYGTNPRQQVAPTEWSDFRGRLICGEVHDENAYFLGGLEGHTGVFATIGDLSQVAASWLTGLEETAWETVTPAGEPRRTLLFTVDDPQFGAWPEPVYGHTGFTGTSLVLIPARGVAIVLLTNRVYPRRKEGMEGARRRIHEGIRALLDD